MPVPIISNEQRDRAYTLADPARRALYASPKGGRILRAIAERYGVTDENAYRNYAVTVGDVVLGLGTLDNLPEMLANAIGVGKERANMIANDLQPFFALLNETEEIGVEEFAEDIARVEAELEALSPLHTMAGDAAALGEAVQNPEADAPIHRSSQPSFAKDYGAPRWESDEGK
jgi:archaellum component FlaC